jgi:hypothetical protein
MTLRLVLVSLVAALGLTVPSAPVIESWVASTQNWMNARFADCDTRSPQPGDYVIVNDDCYVGRLAPRPAHLRNEAIILTPPLITRKPPVTIRFDAVTTVGNLTREFQRKLDEWRGTLLSLLAAALQPTSAPRLVGSGDVSKKPRGLAPAKVIELCQGIGINPAIAVAPGAAVAATRPAVVTPTHSLASPSSFGPMETDASLYFAGELTPEKTNTSNRRVCDSEQVPATLVASRPSLSEAAESSETQVDSNIEMVGEPDRQDDGFGNSPIVTVAPASSATPSFKALEVESDCYVGIAYELNSCGDGLHVPAEQGVRTTRNDLPAPHSAREISRAMRLTREAVYAWVNVFTGPALVTVSRSN